MPDDIKILVCYHAPAPVFANSILTPIHLGRALAKERLGKDAEALFRLPLGDDTGDNISRLNARFSEMTGIYWAWKNYARLGNPAYIGFLHYRRLLDFIQKPGANCGFVEKAEDVDPAVYAEEAIRAAVAGRNFCVRQPVSVVRQDPASGKISKMYTVREDYERAHAIADLNLAFSLLAAKYPAYASAAEEYGQSKKHFLCNLFVMKRDLFFHYAQVMFDVLLEADERIDYTGYSDYQKRAPAFLSERLSGVFFHRLTSGAGAKYRYLRGINIGV